MKKRQEPLCFAYHIGLEMYVPVIEINKDHIIWDDNQISREDPPCQLFEIAQTTDFDFTMPVYNKED